MAVSVPVTAGKVLDLARGELGQHEEPANSNKTKYGAWFGMNGVAWCNIFVTWVLHHAGATNVPKFSYTPSSEQWFKDHGAWRDPRHYKPKPGDIVWFNFPNDGVNRTSHIGIIEGNLDDGRVATIEGNTNGAGGRTGGQVLRHNRSIAGGIVGYGVIDYAGPHKEEDPFMALSDDEQKELLRLARTTRDLSSKDVVLYIHPQKGKTYYVRSGIVAKHIPDNDTLQLLLAAGLPLVDNGGQGWSDEHLRWVAFLDGPLKNI